ncbi:hypothetical protein N8H74_13695 [Pseudomonas sp. B2M1-30]|uniref:hypothetical protein n=1 Tax=Pseudomonas TaxID=286 RepID=UPI0021C9B6D4|nr:MULTISPECIES: hypothetical protein [Pseudomonas]MCU0119312.1 hypothetical protein [Pseudomonas sp. B2M1-30]MCU7262126.1 hypothetical protein [Pseudomonas koreensis]
MTSKALDAFDQPHQPSASGAFVFSIPGYGKENFNLGVRTFYHQRDIVVVVGEGEYDARARLICSMVFPDSIENKKYFFGQAGAAEVPTVSRLSGGTQMYYNSYRDQGYITIIRFDPVKGEFDAEGNFTFYDHHDSKRDFQVIFKISTAGMIERPGE